MNTEEDATQIINVILAAGELKRSGPILMTEIGNAVALASYSAGGFEESVDYEEEEDEDSSEFGLDDLIRQQSEGILESEDYQLEEGVFEEDDEDDSEEVLFVSAFSNRLKESAMSAFRKNQESKKDLLELNVVAISLAAEIQKLTLNNAYLQIVAAGNSELDDNANNLLTLCNRFVESFTNLDEVNKNALPLLLKGGINNLIKELKASPDFSDRLKIIADTYTRSLMSADEPDTTPGEAKDISEEIPGIKVEPGEEKELIGPPIDEFLLESDTASFISGWTRKTLDAYDSFERKHQDELLKKFTPQTLRHVKRTSLSFVVEGTFSVQKLDQLLEYIYNPKFPKLLYKQAIPGLDDGKSFDEEIGTDDEGFLNFAGSIFYGKFESVSDAIGANIIRSTPDNSVLVELDNKKLKDIQTMVNSEIYLITEMTDKLYAFAVQNLDSKVSLQHLGAKVNLYRRLIAKKLDYLIGSIKARDIGVITFVNNQDYLKNSDKDLIKNNCLISNIQSQDGLFFRDKALYEELVMRLVTLLKPASSNNIFNNEKQRLYKNFNISWEEVLSGPYQDLLISDIGKIIRKHLSSANNLGNVSEDISKLSEKMLIKKLEQQELDITVILNMRNKCSVCGKLVYRDYNPVRRGGFGSSEDKATYEAQIYNPEKEIRYDIHSLVRDDGTIISLSDLVDAKFEIGDEEHSKLEEISKAYKRADPIDRIKSWEDIEKDYYSGDSFKNVEAIIRKSHALKALGGRLLSSNIRVYTSRVRCPFGRSADVMKEKFNINSSRKESYLSKVWDCGFNEKLPQVRGLGLYLEDMVASNAMTEDLKNRLMTLSKSQAAGGFKFSSRSFACPEKISVPSDKDKAKNVVKAYPLLVMPSSWPKSTFTGKDVEPNSVHPITQLTRDGESIVSLRCGARTSISQFDRTDFANKIKALIDSENEDLYNGLINSMIELGVDVSDILPFTALKHSYSEIEDPDFAIDSSVIDNLMIRSSKISALLKSAMATSTTKKAPDQIDVGSFFDYIGDIKLTCHNNHSFSISDSLSFANNYIDIPLTKARSKMINAMIRKDVFNKSGQSQFDLLLGLKNGPLKLISRNKAAISGMKPYSEFLQGADKVSNVYFVNPNDPDGDFVYIDSGNALSIYPMFSEFMTANTTLVEKAGIVKSEYAQKSISGISASDSMAAADGDSAAKALMNAAASGRTAGMEEVAAGEDVAERSKEITKQISKLNSVAIALVQNAIISIQELLLAASATSKEDVSFYGTKILKNTLEEKINSEFFSSKLSDLLGDLFNRDDYEYLTDYKPTLELISSSVENIKRSINEDFGKDPRAFVYAIGSTFNRYLHKKIIEGVLLVAQDSGDNDFLLDLRDIFIQEKALSVSQVASAIPSFVDPGELMEFEKSISLKPVKFIQNMHSNIASVKGDISPKIQNITEMWLGKQMVIAATAIYLSDRLADLYSKYFSTSSYKYAGYPLMPRFNLFKSEDVMSTTIEMILGANTGALFPKPKDEEISDLLELMEEVVSELIQLQDGAAYASRSSHYQERALDYIRNIYGEALNESDISSADKANIDKLLNKVVFNTRNVEVLLTPPDSGKYSEYFSRFENAHMLMPSINHPVLLIPPKVVDKYVDQSGRVIQRERQAEREFSRPIYLIKNGKDDYSHILNVKSDIAFRGLFVLLASQGDVDLIKSLLPVEEADDLEANNPQYFNNGWRLLYGNIDSKDVKRAGLVIKDTPKQKETEVSICNHPGTFIVKDDEGTPISYKNITLGIDSQIGLAIGSHGRLSISDKFYPPLKDSVSSVGIPIPIEIGKSEFGLSVTLSDMPIDIPAASGDMIRVNLSDLLQRDPPEEANRILLEIERDYADFLRKYDELKDTNKESAESIKEEFASSARSKFNKYRSLPLKVVRNNFGRTKLDDANRYVKSAGLYIPMVNPVVANTILTKGCFGGEYAGSGIFSKDVYDDETLLSIGINAVQAFLVKINGYDKLASLFNGHAGMVNGEAITGFDLLDPYRMLVREQNVDGKYVTRISGKLLLGESAHTRLVYDEKSEAVEGVVSENPSARYNGSYTDDLIAWRTYMPSFYSLNVGKGDDSGEANVGVPKLVVDTPIFKRKKLRDMSGVRSQDIGSDILSSEDLSPMLMRESRDAGGVYYFAEVLQKFFGKKFKGIKEFIEEYDQIPFDEKTAYFDSASLFNKVSSNILCSDFIKKSEKYQTEIFGRIIVNDEAMRRLFD